MLYVKVDYKCPVCSNRKNFYIMQVDEKLPNGDFVSSNNNFLVECKSCRQKFLLTININPKVLK